MTETFDPAHEAEFDQHADTYDAAHRRSIRASGEDPAYFAEYKARFILRALGEDARSLPLLEFGSGVGNLLLPLAAEFSEVHGYDPSRRCVDACRSRVPVATLYDDERAIPRGRFRAVVVANVLHHVPPPSRPSLLSTLRTLLAPNGSLFIFEHNPLNPVTRKAVRDCAFDEHAVLLYPWETRTLARRAGLSRADLSFIVFFPRALQRLRPLEPRLGMLPLGAQYVVHAAE